MKKYTIELDSKTADLLEGIACLTNCQTEKVIEDVLYKIIEIIARKIQKAIENRG